MMETYSELGEKIVSGSDVVLPDGLKSWLAQEKLLYIDGEFRAATLGKTFEDVNPATEEVLCQVSLASSEDVSLAIGVAKSNVDSEQWSQTSLEDRAKVLHQIADAIDAHRAPLAVLETLDTGKPIRESYEGDILRAASNFRFFADFGLQQKSPRYENEDALHYSIREPVGVVALITPWNLPLYLETWKIAPALLMGNSVILKPSELTPLTASYFTQLLAELNLPKGTFQLLHGLGDRSTGEFLVSDPRVDAISFTGETRTGSAIMKAASVGPTKVSFELGGKGASVVFADADMDKVIVETARAAFRNQGEICLACPRIFVEKKCYPQFKERFLAQVSKIRVGNPLNYQTSMGALIGKDHYEKVSSYLDKISSTENVLAGGTRPEGLKKGFFLMPTVVEGLSLDHPISREEVFGPMVSLYSFEDEDEVVQAVNDTPYGLSSSIWTQDLDRAERLTKRFKHGLLWVNCWFLRDLRVPFGGKKKSGVGREGGTFSLDFFSDWKSICIKN